jgi:cytochrome c oxidase accessory protein FixG
MLGFSGSRIWVYTRAIQGRFQRLHRVSGVALIAFLVVVPWLTLGGMPVARIDLPARKLYLLGSVFTAADIFMLVLLALLAAFSLFFFTSLFGRVWCGYTCPQTVFLEEWIRPVETMIEGDRSKRMRRDSKGWTFDRIWRKVAKFSAFALMAAFVGTTVVTWFGDPRLIWTGQGGSGHYTIAGVVASGLFVDWVWFREQLCGFLCPYARFQSALVDDHSLIISYDVSRGEPRKKGRLGEDEDHCIDCGKCVHVCPAGIDIRDGFQLECVSCARCIDACESVMPKLGRPTLVRYSTIATDEGRSTRLVRKRTVAYAALLTVISGVFLALLVVHQPIEVTVNRSPGTLFQVDDDGWVRNTFLLQVMNNDASDAHSFRVTVDGLPGAQLTMPPITLDPMEHRTIPLVLRVPADSATRTMPFEVYVSTEESTVKASATFKAPPRAGEG